MNRSVTSEERFGPEDLEAAVDDLSMLPFFPENARGSVIALLARMVPHKRALKWLVSETVNHVGKWPGPAELRGLLCSKFEPIDGVDHWCTLPGYSAEDQEAKHLAIAEEQKSATIAPASRALLQAALGGEGRK